MYSEERSPEDFYLLAKQGADEVHRFLVTRQTIAVVSTWLAQLGFDISQFSEEFFPDMNLTMPFVAVVTQSPTELPNTEGLDLILNCVPYTPDQNS